MKRVFSIGNPIKTDAALQEEIWQSVSAEQTMEHLPYLQVEETEEGYRFSYPLNDTTRIYGLGEQVRGINKRGFEYVSLCSDNPNHHENAHSLYGAHNFLVVSDGPCCFGLFLDTPSAVRFDCGFWNMDELVIHVPSKDMKVYFMEEDGLLEVIKAFRQLIGKSYVAPKWAFGYQQSRWGYMDEGDIRNVAKRYKELDIPLDAIYLDIDYMERFKDFTIHPERFPRFEELVADMKAEGVHLVPIIDAGVKVEEGYPVYEEGVALGHFCKNAAGEDFVVGVWPGFVHLPDMLEPDARSWFGHWYKVLLDKGIEGFWNDMNEPALFYSKEGLEQFFAYMHNLEGKNLDVNDVFGMRWMADNLANSQEDYKRFFHKVEGRMVPHDQVHNLYGYMMTRAAGEAFDEMEPDKRILLFSRSSYIGMHRYGGIWTGDNQSRWSHLLMNLQMMPSLNMCGFIYTGADMGGFGENSTEDLVIRWLGLSMFTPLMRNHAAIGTREQELYQFPHTDIMRNLVKLRYGLVPYLYSEYMKSILEETLMFTPLAFAYPEDARAAEVEDQVLVGESLMIAPVYVQNATGRYVYLPEEMTCYRFRSLEDYDVMELERGDHYLRAALGEVLVFVRPGHGLPLYTGNAGHVTEIPSYAECEGEGYAFLTGKGKNITYLLYEDDGISKAYSERKDWTPIHKQEDL